MNKRYIIIGLILLFIKVCNAQNNFKEGYIITSDLDTIYGKVCNNSYFTNSKYCEFIKNGTDSIKKYYPDNLFGYRMNDGKFYISKKLDDRNVFLEFLIDGKLDIFFYQDNTGTDYYFVATDSLPLREIEYSQGIKYSDGKRVYYESKKYIGLLNYYTLDCPEMQDKIPKINQPGHRSLVSFANKYHDLVCVDEKCIIYEKKPGNIKFSVNGGVNYPFEDSISGINHKNSGFIRVDFLFQIIQKSENMYLGLGLQYNSQSFFDDMEYFKYRIPLSINYLKQDHGISPIFSYELDLNSLMITQAFVMGLKYQVDNLSVISSIDLKTASFYYPYALGIKFGLIFDIR